MPWERLTLDQINDKPKIQVQLWEKMTMGTGPELSCQLTISPKRFFNSRQHPPFLEFPAHVFPAFNQFTPKAKSSGQSLKAYTQAQISEKQKKVKKAQEQPHELEAIAAFPNQIDLHYEALNPDFKALKPPAYEILQYQLRKLEEYLDKALYYSKEKVYIIHGHGKKNALRDAVHRKLRNNHLVKSHKNE